MISAYLIIKSLSFLFILIYASLIGIKKENQILIYSQNENLFV